MSDALLAGCLNNRQPRCVRGHGSGGCCLVQRLFLEQTKAFSLNVPLKQRSGPTRGTCELLQQLVELCGPGMVNPCL
ncbi:unnamed protein product [Tetraodon nigroviridis]|uniref:Chromosome undetermined SCAF14541, whole genome shotgun sequence n=1 Tax=Tetraodon nigroviridis TaxID=99883 RepID=Q4SPA9_TETNG|nr:unnamed protein product [Tetraodon nigroviridis]